VRAGPSGTSATGSTPRAAAAILRESESPGIHRDGVEPAMGRTARPTKRAANVPTIAFVKGQIPDNPRINDLLTIIDGLVS
jgi:hypothetical protein